MMLFMIMFRLYAIEVTSSSIAIAAASESTTFTAS